MIVVIPFCKKDGQLAVKNLEWALELDRKVNFNALLAYDEKTPKEIVKRVTELARQLFRNINEYCYDSPHEESWPLAPNHAWQRVAWHFYNTPVKESWFWWEADAVPLRPRWLDDIFDAYTAGGRPFAGHVVEVMGHFNGVAVYPWNICDFASKALFCRAAAWDYVLKEEVGSDKVTPLNDLILHCWNIGTDGWPTNADGKCPSFPDEAQMLKFIGFQFALWHRCKDGSLIDRIREHNQKKIAANPTKINVPQFIKEIVVEEPEPMGPERNGTFPRTEVLIVSYEKDFTWLKYSLKSFVKYAHGFHGLTVVVPSTQEIGFRSLCMAYDVTLKTFEEAPGKGRTHQQIIKCLADYYVPPDTEFVFHMDSDCIWNAPVSPANYFAEGKPIYIKKRYSNLHDKETKVNSDCVQWKEVSERALGFPVEWYTMCCHPTLYPRWFYQEFRNWIECQHKQPFVDWVLSTHKPFPDGFTEFPTMGAFAHEFFKDSWHWIDGDEHPEHREYMKQHWSHGGITPEIKAQIDQWLK